MTRRRCFDSIRGCAWVASMCLVGLGVTACSTDDTDGTGGTPILKLATQGPGTCIDAPADLGSEVTKLPEVDCSVVHTHEIYAVVDDERDVFPGQQALDEFGQTRCLDEFEPYVGVGPFDSTLTFSWLTPTLESWNNEDDRSVICVVGRFDGDSLLESVKNTSL